MGGEAHSSDSFMYLNVSKGKFVNKKKEIKWDKYTGYIISIDIKDAIFKDDTYKQVEVKMKDGTSEEVVLIQFRQNAYYARGFFARIFKIDVSKPFTICVSGDKDNELISNCFLRQGGQTYVNRQGKTVEAIEPHATFPKPEEIAGVKEKNWAPVIPSMEKVMRQVQAMIAEKGIKIAPKTAPAPASTPAEEFIPEVVAVEEKKKYEDDLPF